MSCDRGDAFQDPQRCDAGAWAEPLVCPGIIPLDGSGQVVVEESAATTLAAAAEPPTEPPSLPPAPLPALLLNISGAGFDPNVPGTNVVELSSGSASILYASPFKLTLLFQQAPDLGPLRANVSSFGSSFGGSSGEPVQVATVRARPPASQTLDEPNIRESQCSSSLHL